MPSKPPPEAPELLHRIWDALATQVCLLDQLPHFGGRKYFKTFLADCRDFRRLDEWWRRGQEENWEYAKSVHPERFWDSGWSRRAAP